MRKLATIRRIAAIRPIPDADKICAYQVDAWWLVDQKDAYNVGDLVIYVEIDSWMPNSLAPFLSKGQPPRVFEGIPGERLRTVRLRGQVSQGLLLSLNVLPSPDRFLAEVGDDVTAQLGIIKYEPPIPAELAGLVKGAFPSVFPKTDEERIQNLVNEWPHLSQLTYEVTEKLEGASMSVGLIDNEFVVCTRNMNLKESESNTLWVIARKYDLETKMRSQGLNNIIFQGELIGEGIQKNYYGIKGHEFYVFAMYDIQSAAYVTPGERGAVSFALGLKHAPVILSSISLKEGHTIESLLAMADGPSQINPNKKREGLVFKAAEGMVHEGGQEHFKVISNAYLLKQE